MSENSYPRSYFGDAPAEIIVPADTIIEQKKSPARRNNTINNIKRKKLEMYEKQESKRAPKVQIDQKIVLWTWIIGIIVAFIASAVVSFNGITAVSQFVGLSAEWIGYLFFFFIELMYLLFLIAYLLLASRVDENGKAERTAGAFWGMFSFGAIAILANGFHTIDFWNYDFAEPRLWAGTVLAVAAPIAIISASKMASRVVFAKAIKVDA